MNSVVSACGNSDYDIYNSRFKIYLNEMFQLSDSHMELNIDYVEPYRSQLGHHSAQISSPYHQDLTKILSIIRSLKLSRYGENGNKESDIITTCIGDFGITTQIIFTNDRALNIFKEAVIKIMRLGIVPIEILFRALSKTKINFYITSSENNRNVEKMRSIKYTAENDGSATQAQKIIREKVKGYFQFGGSTFFKRKGNEIVISGPALDELVEFCKRREKSDQNPISELQNSVMD